MAAKSSPPPAKVTLGLVLSWIFGIAFGLAGITGTVEGSLGVGIPLLLAALVLLPPAQTFARDRWRFELSAGLRIVIVLVLLVIAGAGVNSGDDARASAADSTTAASDALSSTADAIVAKTTAPTPRQRAASVTIDRVQVQAANLFPIRVTVTNTGDVAITPKFDVTVTNTRGDIVCSGSPLFDEFATVPAGSAKTGEFSILSCSFSEDGTYTLRVDLLDADYTKLATDTEDFTVRYWSQYS